MFKDEDTRQFLLYTALLGIMLVLISCIVLLCIVPGNEHMCRIPFISEEEDDLPTYIYTDPPSFILNEDVNYEARLVTDMGTIRIDLLEDNAPNTVNNFIFLAEEGYYDGVKIHRLFQDFLFQTGSRKSLNDDPSDDGLGGPGYTLPDEINWDSLDLPKKQREKLEELEYLSTPNLESKPLGQYMIAMANEHRGNTNGSQFFIVTAEDDDTRLLSLQGRHTVFGKIIDGFDVVEEINSARVNDDDPNAPYPRKDIVIEYISIIEIRDGIVEIDGNLSDEVRRDQTVLVDLDDVEVTPDEEE